MMQDIVMPKLGLTMGEGMLAQWIVSEGTTYKKGDPLFEAVTDKITLTVEAQGAGRIVEIVVREGETVPVGAVIARAEVEADAAGGAADGGERPASSGDAGTQPEGEAGEQATCPRGSSRVGPSEPGPAQSSAGGEAIVRASPAAKRLAREHNMDLARIPGTGPGGRVVEGDVQAFLDRMLGTAADIIAHATGARAAREPGPGLEGTCVPYTAIARTAAERTATSFRTAPHFYISMDVDAGALVLLRETLVHDLAGGEVSRPSINDILVKVVAGALAEHRHVNASAADDGVIVYQEINIGVAVATDQGLVVPVVHDADRKTIHEIAREAKELAARAREGRLGPEDVSGGTFTISNLGMFGVDEFFAIINPPQAAILGVGAVREHPLVKDGAIIAGRVMRLSLSADHRVLDGASAARFLRRVREIIESLGAGASL